MIKQIAFATIASAALATSASATVHVLNLSLDGGQQVPPNASAGTGSATVTVDDVANTVGVAGTFSGLGSLATTSHIHAPALAGSTAGPILPLIVSAGTSGSLLGNATLTAGQISDILAGMSYINLHSSGFPGGEIRGQIPAAIVVPTVSEWGMIVFGLVILTGGTLVIRRRVAQTAVATA